MCRPNFFIVGAAKSGTTSLYNYLRQFSQVFLPDVKEPVCFGSDLDFDTELCVRKSIHNMEEYLKLYESAQDCERRGDATVWYLYSELAAQEIHDFDPDAKIVILLRNPVDVMQALHSEFLWDCNENIRDFAEAIQAQEARQNGEKLGPTTHFRQGLIYEDVVAYVDQVQRYIDVFGREKIFIGLFDDIVADSARVFRQVADYLELDAHFQPEVTHSNERKPAQLHRINQFFAARPKLRRILFSNVFSQAAKRRAIGIATKLLGKRSPRKDLDPEIRRELLGRQEENITRLGQLLNRDLSHWLSD